MAETRETEGRKLPALVITLLGILWLAVFPLACDFTYAHITEAKWTAMWVGTGLSIPAACFVLGWMEAGRMRRPALLPLFLVLGLLSWTAVAAHEGSWADAVNDRGQLVTIWGDARFEGLLAQAGYTLIFLGMSLYPVKLCRVSAAAAAALGLFTLLTAVQYTGTNPLGFFPEGFNIRANYEFQGTIGNIDMVVGYLALVTPLTLLPWLLRGGAGRGWAAAGGLCGVALFLFTEVQAGYFALAVLCAALVYFMLTRPACRGRGFLLLAGMAGTLLLRRSVLLPWLDGSEEVCLNLSPDAWKPVLLGLGAAGLLAGLLLRKREGGKGLSRRTALLILGGLALCSLLAVALLPLPQSAGGLWELHEILQGRPQDSFGSERWGVWRIAVDMALDHPVAGIGPDTFSQAEEGYLADAFMLLEQHFDNPHNLFLGYLYASGFPGLLLYLALLGVLLRQCLRGGDAGAVLGVALLCYLAQGCFTFSICLISPMAWAVMGMAAALGRGGRRQDGEHNEGRTDHDHTGGAETESPSGAEARLCHHPADRPDGGAAPAAEQGPDEHGGGPLHGPDRLGQCQHHAECDAAAAAGDAEPGPGLLPGGGGHGGAGLPAVLPEPGADQQ